MTVKELWDEYRISKQYESITGAMRQYGISDGIEEYMRPESTGTTIERRNREQKGKAIWIERISVPRWFLYEIGYVRGI